jgi:nucleoid-associated protein YgaU
VPLILCFLVFFQFSAQATELKFKNYLVKNSETLMLIAFNQYRDYSLWRQILADNQDVLKDGPKLVNGMVIKLRLPLRPFEIESRQDQSPYLIKSGDTLGRISTKVYGVHKYWRDIYLNNRDQIKDPNLIFAGFTLYYRDLERRPAFDNRLY